ncbi:hypothetical protein Tsubulata_030220 [Turnera subulata]|uniref:Senescence domain-containing protein n=1 Tax=Turnera subulata TaxID=218843 RepID=A0A9Q0G4Z0_9ROSI|nr:hypothetical protein Tsubulata_030220 [Turnera subulata]
MASHNPNHQNAPLYPQINQSNPDSATAPTFSSSSSNLYPKIDMSDLVENLIPEPPTTTTAPHHHPPQTPNPGPYSPSAPPMAAEETLVKIPGAILNLIDKNYSVELACGDLSVVRIVQGTNVVAVLVRVADEIQWPLGKDEAAVKLDGSHYFFSLRVPREQLDSDSSSDDEKDKSSKKKKKSKEEKKKGKSDVEDEMLNYGLTIASKGQERLLKEFDEILKTYGCFSEQKVSAALDAAGVARDISPAELKAGKKEELEGTCVGYWTTLAPNVEDYSSTAARLIATGSGQLIKGILWCGDVTSDRMKWGNEVMKQRMTSHSNAEISPETMKRIERVKRMTKMTEKVANGVLSGVVKVAGLFTSSVANSKMGKKIFGLLPGEIVLASLDGFSKMCDAVEVAGKNVMSTSSTVTTELVTHRYGEEAARATSEGLDAAGHAFGTAWAVFKVRQALNPKNALKPTALTKSAAKAAAAGVKAKSSK